jgi:four helix bundle protein
VKKAMKTESIIQTKSFNFSIQIIETYKELTNSKREFILSKQLLRSGTSIGANITEAEHSQSIKDFVHKLSISRKEANESIYWIKLLAATDYLSSSASKPLLKDCEELLRLLTSIIKTTKERNGLA